MYANDLRGKSVRIQQHVAQSGDSCDSITIRQKKRLVLQVEESLAAELRDWASITLE